jgi:hypothetical protein
MSAAAGRILFVTSNGTGLGHLTRSMAIARRLGALEPLFLTFSAGAPVVRELGFPVEYVASYERPGSGTDITWTLRARSRLAQAVREIEPRVVLFDGTHPYERLLPALRASGARLVWCRRAMWRPDSDTAPLWRSHLFDAVLEPGEWAAAADAGPTVARRAEVHATEPVVLLDRSDVLSREQAARELGLAPGRTNVLVQLGQGEGVKTAAERCLHFLAAREGVQAAAPPSTLDGLDEVPAGVVRLAATYPISRYLAAFDAAVSAAGYNAFHELVQLGPPTLFVPMPRQTDDQSARARHAQERGVARACCGPGDPRLEEVLAELLDPSGRARMRERLEAERGGNGAAAAVRWLEELAAAPGAGARGAGGDAARPSASTRLRRAWIFASTAPRTALRVARQLATRPRLRVVVVALGLRGESSGERVIAAVRATGEDPRRVLVVTDRLDFRRLLAAGVGFEHVPAQGERQPELAGVPYEEFRRGRLELILARRPRRRRIVSLT